MSTAITLGAPENRSPSIGRPTSDATYVVVGAVEGGAIRQEVAEHLPDYIVSAVVVVPELPLTVNDKVNRAELVRRAGEFLVSGEPRVGGR